ncbi:DUF6506 family protein [Bosea sp. BIWAKO-01]|uniref:DUF6506 family protein n=1 Tax=Bosea sp. BIWAKO-01 TaxID=506668 RepID=UPI0008535F35|nr:DUF6506 family protein [Bosea sp. BIWAKO-01]GAU84327.1 hypothetical protein BIWAKO_04261 [Bosea sp. BIWAKO-01]
MNIWASMILMDGSDPAIDRIVRETASERLTIVFVPTPEAAPDVARALIAEGVELIELCGGFGVEPGAAVVKAVAGRAAVGLVSFGIDSLTQAAAYKAKFEAGG